MRILIALTFVAALVQAQSLEEKLAKELEKPFVKKTPWVLDFDDAQTQAKAGGKLIVGYFTRSYAP